MSSPPPTESEHVMLSVSPEVRDHVKEKMKDGESYDDFLRQQLLIDR